MEVIHIAKTDNDKILVTYMLEPEEFEALTKEALAKGELDETMEDTDTNTVAID